MHHDRLDGAGRRTHREIDQYLPTARQKQTLRNLLANAELELVAPGNSGFDQDGNWRIRIDASGDLLLEVRSSGSWTQKDQWLA